MFALHKLCWQLSVKRSFKAWWIKRPRFLLSLCECVILATVTSVCVAFLFWMLWLDFVWLCCVVLSILTCVFIDVLCRLPWLVFVQMCCVVYPDLCLCRCVVLFATFELMSEVLVSALWRHVATLKTKAANSSGIFIPIYQFTRCHRWGDSNFHI